MIKFIKGVREINKMSSRGNDNGNNRNQSQK